MDRDGKVSPLSINTVDGKTAPRFDATVHELTPLNATITAKGMSSGWPSVDIHFEDTDGKRHVYITSGRMMMLMLAGAIQAAVIRNGSEPDYVPVMVLALEGKHPHARAMELALREISEAVQAQLLERVNFGETIRDATGEDFFQAVKAALLDVLR